MQGLRIVFVIKSKKAEDLASPDPQLFLDKMFFKAAR